MLGRTGGVFATPRPVAHCSSQRGMDGWIDGLIDGWMDGWIKSEKVTTKRMDDRPPQ